MGKHSRKLDVMHHAIRPGEGALVDVSITNFAEPGGMSGAHLTLNTNSAPVPDRRYVADVFSVTTDVRSVKLLFAQKRIGKNGSLRSMLVIHMSQRAASQFLDSVEAVKNPSFDDIAKREGFRSEAPAKIDEEPDQTVALSANFALCAVSGPEASVDFYQASPFAILAVVRSRKLALDAVVRVDMPSPMFLGMIDELEKIKGTFPANQGGVS